ncbi:hypothetical protein IPA_02590 [Ignicoccus pacificus DSM 13166]|uniref:Polymerase nucleotidyl transferase domain-containing protein n=1 Tax=Ignicoccus pacificus DSM 13166 TaxID=940294 RepID=A0A977KAS5_9CREN|nr:hypothetical protein IPA_02590 [Ignicoccus pacificus DSM 13166]
MYEQYQYLKNWRKYVKPVLKAIKEELGDAEVYLFGGVAKGKFTAASDLDIMVVIDKDLGDKEVRKLTLRIVDKAFSYGLPLDYPIDLHVVRPKDMWFYGKIKDKIKLSLGEV